MTDSQTAKTKKQLTLYIPHELTELLRTEAFELRVTQTSIIEGLLREHYADMGLLDSQTEIKRG